MKGVFMSIKDFRPSVLISSGGTQEMVDNVRCMSNISTGQTGATIAEMVLANGWEVFYVHGVGAKLPNKDVMQYPAILHTTEITSAKNAMDVILDLAPNVDSCIMALAVSDFTFELSEDVKLDSSDAYGFIEYLSKTIRSNVKILPQIRSVAPDAYIMGFKYTVGKTQDEQIKIARAQILTANLDSTFVNDDVDMRETGSRCGRLVMIKGSINCLSRVDTAKAIYSAVSEVVRQHAESSIGFKLMDIKNPFKT
jgi:phosphopantothenoylcysteine decarboxylase/phosphopantothenate--cysteine ligase